MIMSQVLEWQVIKMAGTRYAIKWRTTPIIDMERIQVVCTLKMKMYL